MTHERLAPIVYTCKMTRPLDRELTIDWVCTLTFISEDGKYKLSRAFSLYSLAELVLVDVVRSGRLPEVEPIP